jgi:hypothetical protein
MDLHRPPLPPSTRVPVTNSTLLAYQAMRGNNDMSQIQFGSLHESLYFYPADGPLEYRYAKIDLPKFPQGKLDMLDGYVNLMQVLTIANMRFQFSLISPPSLGFHHSTDT